MLPYWAIESLEEYVRIGRPVGDFLEAVLSNDLMDAFGRADNMNQVIMIEYCKYVHNKMPMGCHGSREIYKNWCKSGGLEGDRGICPGCDSEVLL
jgi:hypothetical protein